MDLLYTINRKTFTKSSFQETTHDEYSLCSISSRNIVAFTAVTELDDTNSRTWGCHVYVCDLNVPWHYHKILTNKALITALKWDLPGEKLVIADSSGVVQLWTLKDHILNEWIFIGSHYFSGEHILGVAWFHNGKRTTLVVDKKDSTQFSEKFSHLPYAPSVKQFGGCAAQGVLVVSNTGLLGAMIIQGVNLGANINQEKQNSVCFATESIGSIRQRITAVDITYGKNGQFLVAVSSGHFAMPIRCFRVSVRKVDDKCNITSQALPSFFLQDGAPRDDTTNASITHLKFAVSESLTSLIVAGNNEGGFIQLWELDEKVLPVHKLFQSKSCEPVKTIVWQHQASYRCHYSITAIATLKSSIINPTGYILISLDDSSIHCLSNDGLKEITASSLNTNMHFDEPINKYSKMSTKISYIDISCLGCIFLLVDARGNLYVYKLFPESLAITLNHACTLLEYCLITGFDWLDLLLCLQSSMIEGVCEKFDYSFNLQPLSTQQYYYMHFICIKISLYRMLVSGQNKAADLSSLYMINAVATAFKSLLRPSDTCHDKVPAEKLPLVITDNNITDIDKVLLHIEPKEFTVEPVTVQSLQQLIQWIADLSLNLLVRIPEQRTQVKSSTNCYELLRDQKALNILRELLVIIRIWGLLRVSCLPVFLKSADNIDVLKLLFELLSKLVQSNSENQQLDDQLIDDCCLLPNQIMVSEVNQKNSITAIATPSLFYQSFPLQLQYGSEPDLTFTPEFNQVEGCIHNGQIVDAVRQVYLGKRPLLVKQCARCGAKSQTHNTTRTAAIRAWEQRWARGCPCGGTWRIHNSSQS